MEWQWVEWSFNPAREAASLVTAAELAWLQKDVEETVCDQNEHHLFLKSFSRLLRRVYLDFYTFARAFQAQ